MTLYSAPAFPTFLSVCSGIEAASVAWSPLGWRAIAFAEIEKLPCAVLAHHYPEVPNWGDITRFKDWPHATFDVLVGGTPCQSFSVAGLRQGLADPRGNLALTYLAIADRYRPEWVVWENVPGVRSVDGGRAFGAFLGGLGELGYGWAYRSLDAQYFGLAQRRERVFVVGHLGDWRRAAAVLFEQESLRGDSAPRRETGEGIAPTIASRPTGGGGLGTDFDCDGGLIAGALQANGKAAGSATQQDAECGSHPNAGGQVAVASFDPRNVTSKANRTGVDPSLPANTLHEQGLSIIGPSVRRLTPWECERLQGFPDDYTLIPNYSSQRTGVLGGNRGTADGPRYKALGNSMAVPVVCWIGQRIAMVNAIVRQTSAA